MPCVLLAFRGQGRGGGGCYVLVVVRRLESTVSMQKPPHLSLLRWGLELRDPTYAATVLNR